MPEVYLVHVDNWFDHKWLGWWSTWKQGELKELYVPPFNPNRVRSQKRFLWDGDRSCWMFAEPGRPLHIPQPGRRESRAQRLDQFSKSAAFIWYSGNTVGNGMGSVMLYRSGLDAYAWYASLTKETHWKVANQFRTTRNELASFEERGKQMELVSA